MAGALKTDFQWLLSLAELVILMSCVTHTRSFCCLAGNCMEAQFCTVAYSAGQVLVAPHTVDLPNPCSILLFVIALVVMQIFVTVEQQLAP